MYFKLTGISVVVFVAALIAAALINYLEEKKNKEFETANVIIGAVLLADFFLFFVSLCFGIWNL